MKIKKFFSSGANLVEQRQGKPRPGYCPSRKRKLAKGISVGKKTGRNRAN